MIWVIGAGAVLAVLFGCLLVLDRKNEARRWDRAWQVHDERWDNPRDS